MCWSRAASLATIFRFVERLNGVRSELNILDGDIKAETARFSEDIKYFAEFTTGTHHHPSMVLKI